MGAKSKLIMGAVDALGNKIGALGDYLKEFDPRTFYHYSPDPDITKFDPKTINDPFGEFGGGADYVPPGRGATYFTSDPKYSNKVMEDIHEIGEGKNFSDYDWEEIIGNEQAPTIYPVKIKTKDIFDFENPEHLKRLADDPDDIGDDILEGSYKTFEDEEIQEILKESLTQIDKRNERNKLMGKVKDWLIEMEDDATFLTLPEWIKLYCTNQKEIWERINSMHPDEQYDLGL